MCSISEFGLTPATGQGGEGSTKQKHDAKRPGDSTLAREVTKGSGLERESGGGISCAGAGATPTHWPMSDMLKAHGPGGQRRGESGMGGAGLKQLHSRIAVRPTGIGFESGNSVSVDNCAIALSARQEGVQPKQVCRQRARKGG